MHLYRLGTMAALPQRGRDFLLTAAFHCLAFEKNSAAHVQPVPRAGKRSGQMAVTHWAERGPALGNRYI